jgi:AcrR family transcriptional regulator
MDAARELFARQGFHATAVAEIVARAGLSQGAFYLYFPDKRSIFSAVVDDVFWTLRRRIWGATRDVADPERRLAAGLLAYLEFYGELKDWHRLVYRQGAGIDPAFQEKQHDLYRTLGEALQPTLREAAAGRARRLEAPAITAHALIGTAEHLAYWYFDLEDPASPQRLTLPELASRLTTLTLFGVAGARRPATQTGGSMP